MTTKFDEQLKNRFDKRTQEWEDVIDRIKKKDPWSENFKQEYPKEPPHWTPIEPTEPKPKVPMSMTRQAFYDDVICVQPDVKRLVAKRDMEIADELLKAQIEDRFTDKKSDDGYTMIRIENEIQTETRLWVPEGADDDFNLVLSLCSDGLHRPVFDLDFPKDQMAFDLKPPTSGLAHRAYIIHQGSRTEFKFPSGQIWVFDSTNHCHVYSSAPMMWEDYTELLAGVPGEDARKFLRNVTSKGYGGLRPPWVRKQEKVENDEDSQG